MVFVRPIFFRECFALEMTAGIPAAVVFGFPSFRGMSSTGVLPFMSYPPDSYSLRNQSFEISV